MFAIADAAIADAAIADATRMDAARMDAASAVVTRVDATSADVARVKATRKAHVWAVGFVGYYQLRRDATFAAHTIVGVYGARCLCGVVRLLRHTPASRARLLGYGRPTPPVGSDEAVYGGWMTKCVIWWACVHAE